MRIEALYEYVVFAKHLNFSAAAKELYLSQPGLSIHISNLEKELGFLLVEREKDLRLTPAGSIFLECAQDILDRYQAGLDSCKKISDRPPLVRVLASNDSPAFMTLLSQIRDIPFTFASIASETPVPRALQKGVIDIGFGVDFSCSHDVRQEAEEDHIVWFPFGQFPSTICVMKSHPLAQKKELTRSDFVDASIVINSGAYYDCWKAVVQGFFGEDFPLKFRLEPIGSLSNLAFADFGEAIHICGKETSDTYLAQRDDIVLYESLDGQPLLHTSVIAYRTDNPNENVHAFIAQLKALLGEEEGSQGQREATYSMA